MGLLVLRNSCLPTTRFKKHLQRSLLVVHDSKGRLEELVGRFVAAHFPQRELKKQRKKLQKKYRREAQIQPLKVVMSPADTTGIAAVQVALLTPGTGVIYEFTLWGIKECPTGEVGLVFKSIVTQKELADGPDGLPNEE